MSIIRAWRYYTLLKLYPARKSHKHVLSQSVWIAWSSNRPKREPPEPAFLCTETAKTERRASCIWSIWRYGGRKVLVHLGQVIPPHPGAGIAIRGYTWVSGWHRAATELAVLKKIYSINHKKLVSFMHLWGFWEDALAFQEGALLFSLCGHS